MPLQCQVVLNPSARSGEQPIAVALLVYNPSTTTPIVITGGVMSVEQLGNGTSVPCALPMLPIGPGMPVVVAAGATVLVGPMTLVLHSNAAANSFQTVDANPPVNPQPSDSRGGATSLHYPQYTALIGATLYGSDGSINQAGKAPVFVDVVATPPPGYQGGYLHLHEPKNLANFIAGVI